MSRTKEFFKYFYISLILLICYIPLFTMAVFSFNQTSDKGYVSFTWNGFSNAAYQSLFSSKIMMGFVNSIIIGFLCSLFVVVLSLLTVFSVWKQKNRYVRVFQNVSNNISIINPDVIIGISLGLFFASVFGLLTSDQEGLFRTVIGHTVMSLPFGILVMYPRSEKFSRTIYEASQDLGYSTWKTWFRTYFMHMIPSIIFTVVITFVFSFDDFIITVVTSNTETVGTMLYQGQFRSWALALGSILLIAMIVGNIVVYFKIAKKKHNAKKGYK